MSRAGLAALALLLVACGGKSLVGADGAAGRDAGSSVAGTTGAAGTTGEAGATGAGGTSDAAVTTGAAGASLDASPDAPPDAARERAPEERGAGCGKPLPTGHPQGPGAKGFKQYMVTTAGSTLAESSPAKAGPRSFWVRVPSDYDPARTYRTVYYAPGCGGQGTTGAPVFDGNGQGGPSATIYVVLDTPTFMSSNCFDTRAGLASQEWAAFELVHSVVDANYCVDNARVYVTGYGSGGSLANMLGCYFAGSPTPSRTFASKYHVRAQAVIWGNEPMEQPACGGPVAAIWIHGMNGGSPLSDNLPALERVGRTNNCKTTYDDPTTWTPWHWDVSTIAPALCRRFTGCPAEYPVIFCPATITAQQGPATQLTVPTIRTFFDDLEQAR